VEFRQTDADGRGILAYPFSRAFRFEVQSGVRRIWFSQQRLSRSFDYATGVLLDERRTDLGAPGPMTLGDAAVALVYDQSAFGPTSPIRGQRFRFEVAPTIGSLRFTGVNLDYRRYVTPVRPVTVAVRGLHFGRYGGGGEDPRLSALFLGYPSLVRGYDSGSFDARDCGGLANTCPAFDSLLGSRLLVGNAELRFPLVGVFRGAYDYGPIPVEAFVFGDAGVAWTGGTKPAFAGGDRQAVRSAGVGARVNAFGYAILEFALARPFDRTGRGWVFSFNLLPGW
jgi:outer membrane protein assembly factor BamA